MTHELTMLKERVSRLRYDVIGTKNKIASLSKDPTHNKAAIEAKQAELVQIEADLRQVRREVLLAELEALDG